MCPVVQDCRLSQFANKFPVSCPISLCGFLCGNSSRPHFLGKSRNMHVEIFSGFLVHNTGEHTTLGLLAQGVRSQSAIPCF